MSSRGPRSGERASGRGQRATHKGWCEKDPDTAAHAAFTHTPQVRTTGFLLVLALREGPFLWQIFENVIIGNNNKNNDEASQPSRGPGCVGTWLCRNLAEGSGAAPCLNLTAMLRSRRCSCSHFSDWEAEALRTRNLQPMSLHAGQPDSTSHTVTVPFNAQTTKLRTKAPSRCRALGSSTPTPTPPPQ